MFNRKTEGRSSSLYQSAVFQSPGFPEIGLGNPTIDQKTLDLARLFAHEERLAAIIQNDEQPVDKETIYEIVSVARKVARTGFATNLVETDELLDIAQVFSSSDPDVAWNYWELRTRKRDLPDRGPDRTRLARRLFAFKLTIPVKPSQEEAVSLLVNLLANLDEKENSAWTARVAAVLAYLSALPSSSLPTGTGFFQLA